MLVVSWIIWGLTCLALLMFFFNTFDDRRIVKIASIIICIGIFFALVVTTFLNISKFHLLWFVPVIFIISRSIVGSIVMIGTKKRINTHFSKMHNNRINKKKDENKR